MARTATVTTATNVGYEARLRQMADALRNNMDAAEYKHVVLGLIFLKYLSDAFEGDRHKDLKDDPHCRPYGTPPAGNANYAWVQRFIHHLVPTGLAGFVLANGSMSSNQSGEGEIRKATIDADLVDCMAALPGQLFYSTPFPVCLWFLGKDKNADDMNWRFLSRENESPSTLAA